MDLNYIKSRILEILKFIDDNIYNLFNDKIDIFSKDELAKLLVYLEKGDISILNEFLEEKKEELLGAVSFLKGVNTSNKLKTIEVEEQVNSKKEFEDLDKLLDNAY